MSARLKATAVDADITVEDAYLCNVVLTAGSDAATVVVKSGGSSGTTVLTLKAAANTTVATGSLDRAYCPDGIYVDVTGTAPAVTVSYD